ncbi:MAG: hypothetical protein R3B13_36035 [Polyangiaceae bacterium]
MTRATAAPLLIVLLAGCQEPNKTPQDAPVPPAAGDDLAGDLAELGASANRKLNHEDGKGCLDDLDKMAARAPKLAKTMTALRAQCQMLVGECQTGKRALEDYYVRETNMSPQRAASTVESIAAMRCRGSDMTDRDRLLRALWEISDGAFVNPRKDCERNVSLVRELAPKVPPRDVDDTQVKGGPRALFHNGAACLARAGDCAAAYRVWRENYPADALSKLAEAQRKDLIVDGFRSSIERCKDAPLPDAAAEQVPPGAPAAGKKPDVLSGRH